MERLQAAIKKARESHSGRSSIQHRPAVEEAWQEIKSVELKSATLRRNRIFTNEVTEEAVSFDILRTRTLRQMQQNGWKKLAITSPTPACGKSTISLNLAFAMSRQSGTRTIGIEIDMRQPSQRSLLGLPLTSKKSGNANDALDELLAGTSSFAEKSLRFNEGLALATNGHSVSNASDILLGAQVGQVIKEIEDTYNPDVMIFDMPPMLVNDDTMAFQQHVDCALIIAAAESSTVEEIEKCERDLAAQTNILGVVLNKCRLQSGDSRYGYNKTYGS